MGNEEGKDVELEYLLRNYQKHFEFSNSLEKGINAYNLTIDYLKPDAIEKIRAILKLISDQFSSDPNKIDIDKCTAKLKEIIEDLASNEDKEIICRIFSSLMDVPPNPITPRRISSHRCG
jgi:hypothetical protein